jgi:hypothetical protein
VRGKFPETRHDGQTWLPPYDDERSALARRPLKWRGIVIFIKGDWNEYSSPFGFPTWSSKHHPCPLCSAVHNEWCEVSSLSVFGTKYPEKTFADYDAACTRCGYAKHSSTLQHLACFRILCSCCMSTVRLTTVATVQDMYQQMLIGTMLLHARVHVSWLCVMLCVVLYWHNR